MGNAQALLGGRGGVLPPPPAPLLPLMWTVNGAPVCPQCPECPQCPQQLGEVVAAMHLACNKLIAVWVAMRALEGAARGVRRLLQLSTWAGVLLAATVAAAVLGGGGGGGIGGGAAALWASARALWRAMAALAAWRGM